MKRVFEIRAIVARVAVLGLVVVGVGAAWAQEATPAETQPEMQVKTPAGTQLSIQDYGVGTHVENRELKGKGETFDPGRQVVFWTRVLGGSQGDRVQHVWIHEGKEVISVGLAVGSSHWRTYSRKTLHAGSAGNWAVEARTSTGEVLARAEFTCGTLRATQGG